MTNRLNSPALMRVVRHVSLLLFEALFLPVNLCGPIGRIVGLLLPFSFMCPDKPHLVVLNSLVKSFSAAVHFFLKSLVVSRLKLLICSLLEPHEISFPHDLKSFLAET